MLVLTRGVGEEIIIGEDVVVRVTQVNKEGVVLTILPNKKEIDLSLLGWIHDDPVRVVVMMKGDRR